MRPTIKTPGRGLPPSLSAGAVRVLAIMKQLHIERGDSVPYKPLLINWAKQGGKGGSDLVDAIEELAEAGYIDPVDKDSTSVTRR